MGVWKVPRRTYLDAGVLIAAFKGEGELGRRALEILDDPDRQYLVSEALRLEILPKPLYHHQSEEAGFYEAVFEAAQKVGWEAPALRNAHIIAEKHGIAAMDAIHVAHAIEAEADELVTAEKPTKPMFRVEEIVVVSIRGSA